MGRMAQASLKARWLDEVWGSALMAGMLPRVGRKAGARCCPVEDALGTHIWCSRDCKNKVLQSINTLRQQLALEFRPQQLPARTRSKLK